MAHVKRTKKGKDGVLIDAEFRIKSEKAVEKFCASNEQVYEFPSSLTNVERAFIHNLAPKYGLKTQSSGNGLFRKLSLFKPVEQEDYSIFYSAIELNSQTKSILKDYLIQHPARPEEVNSLPHHHAPIQMNRPTVLRQAPIVPPPSKQVDYNIEKSRQNLPIFKFKDKIIETIDKNRITLIHGSTGSGKTTQIPQYLMDLATQRGEPCKILCTQPRRISAISSAERVCYERGTELGTVVGYQIRLDSKAQSTSNCVFLTPGVFLRYLMAMKPKDVFASITHCIIDEAHEHAKENDFLLTSIREHMDSNPNLRVIIMSATMDTAVFGNYFGGHCEEISIFSKQFEVTEYYLDDVLKMVNFSNKKVEELKRQYERGEQITASKSAYVNEDELQLTMEDLDEETISYLDELLDNMSTQSNPENHFHQFLYLTQNESIPIDYRHSQTKMTPLMIAVGKGLGNMVESLLSLNANPNLQMKYGQIEMSSIDLAVHIYGENSEIQRILLKPRESKSVTSNEDIFNKALVNIYQDSILKSKTNNFIIEESIDHELIIQLVETIHYAESNGAILIFLPGFDDIITVKNLINSRIRQGYTLFMLHSSMKTDDQKNVFKPAYQGKRKIILSTNIAESSITIDDVIYVIDSGREKQKSFDAISHSSSLRVQWISKASANQRRGRAGRLQNGIVYRVYSRDRFQSMLDVTIPELLRTSLSEVCLQTKLLINDQSTIEEFLLKCIAGPSVANIRQSIKYLQKLGALDEEENLTVLGSHLAQMPVDARYGKMLIYSIVLKCFDPILSLVSILSMGDQIFLLPISPADRHKCIQWRKNVAGDSLSDHYMMLRVFQMWTNLRNGQHNSDRQFCEENFISRNHIEHVRGIRRQIYSYLESSSLVGKNTRHLNENSENWSLLKGVICAGLYPFIAKIESKKGMMCTEIDTKLSFHMSSVLCVKKEGYKSTIRRLPAEWAVFEEKNRIGRLSLLKCNTLLNSFTASLMAGQSLTEEDLKNLYAKNINGDSGWTEDELEDMREDPNDYHEPNYTDFKVDKLLKFTSSKDDAKMIFDLKKRLNNLILRFLLDKKFVPTQEDNSLVKMFAKIIEKEDLCSNMIKMDISENSTEQTIINSRVQKAARDDYPQQERYEQNYHQGNMHKSQRYQPQNYHQGYSNTSQQKFNNPRPSSSSHNFQSRAYEPRANVAPRRKLETNYSGPPTTLSNTFKSNQKFFILKNNSKKAVESLASKVVVPIDELNLKIWQYHKIKSLSSNGSNVFIIFYSPHKNEFQGYGEVISINQNLPLQFHYRYPQNIKLDELGNAKFALEIRQTVQDPKFFFAELDHISGNSLILYFQH